MITLYREENKKLIISRKKNGDALPTIKDRSWIDITVPNLDMLSKISKKTKIPLEMLTSSLEHSITFNLETKNKVVKPFIDINVGDFIEFITPTKTYETMVTQLSFKNNLYEVYVTLGEYRISLTDKIKLLSNK